MQNFGKFPEHVEKIEGPCGMPDTDGGTKRGHKTSNEMEQRQAKMWSVNQRSEVKMPRECKSRVRRWKLEIEGENGRWRWLKIERRRREKKI